MAVQATDNSVDVFHANRKITPLKPLIITFFESKKEANLANYLIISRKHTFFSPQHNYGNYYCNVWFRQKCKLS